MHDRAGFLARHFDLLGRARPDWDQDTHQRSNDDLPNHERRL